jgi:RNA recognition motif-containing protein
MPPPFADEPQQSYQRAFPDRGTPTPLNTSYMPGYETWSGPFASTPNNPLSATLGGGNRVSMKTLANRPARIGLPNVCLSQRVLTLLTDHQNWVEGPLNSMPLGFDHQGLDSPLLREGNGDSLGLEEELIPTAIVIKNIPFAVKKEQLVQVMTDMGLPLPYAFNYHFDNGVFRGLAFANFTTPEETALVIGALNHYELAGRKLRVEYKKMLPAAERERIEREKRIKRGQLEEQHRPSNAQLQTQSSLSSLTSQLPTNSPSPVSSRPPKFPGVPIPNEAEPRSMNFPAEINFNDPSILQLYSEILLFRQDLTRETMVLPATLSPSQRRVVHTIAHYFKLAHVSKGSGEQRAVHIFRSPEAANISPPLEMAGGDQRRALARAATTDFSDVRSDGIQYGTLGRQSSGLLGFPDSPGGMTAAHNLRSAKSYHDLRSYTPSPVPSTASFPANLTNNISRFAEYGLGSTGASNPNLTSTVTTLAPREESMLVNGMSAMNMGPGFGPAGSPRSTRNAWEHGAIGSNRNFSTAAQALEEQSRAGAQSARQQRGPAPERGPSYVRRQNGHGGRGSDDMSQQGVDLLGEQPLLQQQMQHQQSQQSLTPQPLMQAQQQ